MVLVTEAGSMGWVNAAAEAASMGWIAIHSVRGNADDVGQPESGQGACRCHADHGDIAYDVRQDGAEGANLLAH